MGAQDDPSAGRLAQTASDADGILHLIALVEDVTGWVVTLNGAPVEQDPDGFRNDPTMHYFGRPSWFIDDGGDWQLTIDGVPVTVWSTSDRQVGRPPTPLRTSTATPADDRSSWAEQAMQELAGLGLSTRLGLG